MTSRRLVTADGAHLAADLALPPGRPHRGGVAVCHPHPLYGGNRSHPMVVELCDALVLERFATLRFDFRSTHDHGVAERLDLRAALDDLEHLDAPAELAPLAVAGYSFGAVVALTTDDPRIAAVVSVAGPLSSDIRPPTVPTLLVVPRHDQYAPPDRIEPVVAAWRAAGTSVDMVEMVVVESCDHFLVGSTARIAGLATEWLTAHIP
ncbi:MAG: hypothetical protein ABIO83_06245 [Ilumatobacteraceae bacterium]